MPNLKELKNKIDSVRSTRKITQAMKMVAASKLRRAQDTAEAARPYSEKMAKIMSSLSNSMADSESSPDLLLGKKDNKTHLILAVTSDRGLCGGFNSSIVKAVKNKVLELEKDNIKFKIICIGRKGFDVLKGLYEENVIMNSNISVKNGYELSEQIGKEVILRFEKDEYGSCSIIYNKFKSAISQIVSEQSIIPCLISDESEADKENDNSLGINFEFEPDESEILADLLPKNISVQIYKAILESGAGEQGARMAAMDNATRNAGEMIDKLNLSYNRQRQAIITGELIEIIAGAEAL
tara:strand:- start:2257 stop:3144 length:888 start_codon:yes stop_codon:yes gene_type:complete